MTQPQSTDRSRQEGTPAELSELTRAVAELPDSYRSQIEPALNRVVEATKRRHRILSMVQDALGQLRLDMKYMMFDLEATRRERDEYRRQLEESGGADSE